METILQHSASVPYSERQTKTSALSRIINWCDGQQHNRLLWLWLALVVHGCILTPLTVMAVLLSGAGFGLFMVSMVAMGMALVTNLAAMPTKITIPVFALTILIDIAILMVALALSL